MTGFARLDEHSLREFRRRIESAFHFAGGALSEQSEDQSVNTDVSLAEFYQLQLSVIPIVKKELWPQYSSSKTDLSVKEQLPDTIKLYDRNIKSIEYLILLFI